MNERTIVFFGSGVIAEKILHLNPAFIVDNNTDLHGKLFHGIEILPPKSISNQAERFKIIICTTSISEVRTQLEDMGYKWEVDIEIADLLSERLEVMNLENKKFSFLTSSGLPSHVNDLSGGGVFHITETGSTYTVDKIFEGNVHGLIKIENGYAFNAQGEGLFLISKDNLSVTKLIDVPKGLRPHGMAQYGDKNEWLIVSSYDDSLVYLDKNGSELRRYPLSEKLGQYKSPQHHCNDVFVHSGYAYVSMFSVSGNWKRGIFDGGIVEIDLESGQKRVICNHLTMPHNVCFFDGDLKVLDSFKGEILLRNFEVWGQLPGFARGYDEDETYMFVGESKNRNFSKLNTRRRPVSIDTRITVINKKLGFSRSIQLPKTISEIHSVVSIHNN